MYCVFSKNIHDNETTGGCLFCTSKNTCKSSLLKSLLLMHIFECVNLSYLNKFLFVFIIASDLNRLFSAHNTVVVMFGGLV
jgi:hypothetical protein